MHTKNKRASLRIDFENHQEKERVGYGLKLLLRLAIEETLRFENVDVSCEVSLTFTDNDGIHVLNKTYRNIDRATDVLSFPQINYDEGETAEGMLGDIVLSLEHGRIQYPAPGDL